MQDRKEEKEKQAEENKKLVSRYEKGIFRRIFSYLNTHCISFIIGVLITIINGLVYPIFSVFLSRIINALFLLESTNPTRVAEGRHDADIASLAFLLLAIGSFIGIFIRDVLTELVGDEITIGIRK